MPQILSRTPYGAAVQQDDGNVVFLPPEAVPIDATEAGVSPTPARVGQAPPATGGPVTALLGGQPLPTVLSHSPRGTLAPEAPEDIEAPTPRPPADLPSLPPPGSGIPGNAPVDETGAPLPMPMSAVAPQETPRTLDPWEEQERAQRAAGDLALIKADRQAEIDRQTAANVADLSAQGAERLKKIQDLRTQAAASEAAAVDEQAKYDLRAPEETSGQSALRLIALVLGGIGKGMTGQAGPNPVIAVLQQKAEDAARERLRRYQQLGDTVEKRSGVVDALGKVYTDEQAYLNGAIAVEWKKNEQRALALGREFSGAEAKIRSEELAAESRQRAVDFMGKATDAEWKRKKEAIDLDIAQQQANTAEYNARTGRYQASIAAKAQTEAGRHNRASETIALLQETREAIQAGKPDVAAQKWESEKEGMKILDVVTRPGQVDPVTGKPDRTLRNADGSPVVIDNPTERAKLRSRMAATVTIANLIDDTIGIMDKEGGSSGALGEGSWQRVQSNLAAMDAITKEALQLGALDAGVATLVSKLRGSKDPTSFVFDAKPGLQQMRQNMVGAVDRELKGYWQPPPGVKYEIPTSVLPDAPVDPDIQALQESQVGKRPGSVSPAIVEGRSQTLALESLAKRGGEKDRIAIDTLVKAAQGQGTGDVPEVAARARAILLDLMAAGNDYATARVNEARFWDRGGGQ